MKNGIIIGKFYPLHNGHLALIDFGLSQVDELTVIVCDKEGQSIPARVRANWIKKLAPKAKVIIVPDIGKDDDSQAWADYTLQFLGYKPDCVITSEEYGNTWAACLKTKHIMFDHARKIVPICATRIRENPLANWQYLPPPVRAYFAKRICVIGAESTGTTTLAKDLAKYYQTNWVPEYGRYYSEAKLKSLDSNNWKSQEFTFIAKKQNESEDELAKSCNKILICDTDSFATALWHERYMGTWSKEVEKLFTQRNIDYYLVTNDDIPFVQDGTRDGEHIRHQMHQRFIEELKKRNKKFAIISGSKEDRLNQAVDICNQILGKQNSFANAYLQTINLNINNNAYVK
jgi:NadR type nicotinamide-nucleotide adenylyltransferase